jgi:transposase
MKDTDGRRLSHEALEQLRINAVLRVEAGESPEVVIRSIGFERACIYHWIAKYRFGGIEALKSRKAAGRQPILNGVQLMKLFAIVKNETPEQYEFPFALWTVALIREVIKRSFNVSISEVSVWRTLKKLGLTPQRPLRRAWQQKSEAVKQFIEKDYPLLKAKAKRFGATIYWGDEASVRSDYHAGTTWGVKGETPIVKTTGARFKINMISAVSSKGILRFMVTESGLTAPLFVQFLKRLVQGQKNPVYLIVDGHPVHKARMVKDFVAAQNGFLELHYLPGYSPELNPDELVWNHVKRFTVGRKTITGPDQLRGIVSSALKRLSKLPKIVQGFFGTQELSYIVS